MHDDAGNLHRRQAAGEDLQHPVGQAQGLKHGRESVNAGLDDGGGRGLQVRARDGGDDPRRIGQVCQQLIHQGPQGRAGLLDPAPHVARRHAPGEDGVVLRVAGGDGADGHVLGVGGQHQGRQGLLVPAEGAQLRALTGVHDDAAVQARRRGHCQGPLQQSGLQRHHVGAHRGDHHGAGTGRAVMGDRGQLDVVGQGVEGRRAHGDIGRELPGQGLHELTDARAGHNAPARGRRHRDPALDVGHERQAQQVGGGREPLQAHDHPALGEGVGDRLGRRARRDEHAVGAVPALRSVLGHGDLLWIGCGPLCQQRGRHGEV